MRAPKLIPKIEEITPCFYGEIPRVTIRVTWVEDNHLVSERRIHSIAVMTQKPKAATTIPPNV